jgi:hypothetical protein
VPGGSADVAVAGRSLWKSGGDHAAASPTGPPRASPGLAPALPRCRGPARGSRPERPDPGAASSFYVSAVPFSPAMAPDLRPAAQRFPAAPRFFRAAPPGLGVAGACLSAPRPCLSATGPCPSLTGPCSSATGPGRSLTGPLPVAPRPLPVGDRSPPPSAPGTPPEPTNAEGRALRARPWILLPVGAAQPMKRRKCGPPPWARQYEVL